MNKILVWTMMRGANMYCRHCGKELNENADYCTSCGVSTNKGNAYCSECGAETSEVADVCVKCGAKLKKVGTEPKSKIVAGLLGIFFRGVWRSSFLFRLYNNWSCSINIKCFSWIFYMWDYNCISFTLGIC